MKTGEDIKDDVYKALKGTDLVKEVTGTLRKRDRLEISDKEDVIISILGNELAQYQTAYVNVNIYVQDVWGEGQLEMHDRRIKQLCRMAMDEMRVIRLDGGRIRITLEKQEVIRLKDNNEHMINNRLLYAIIHDATK